jgi:Ca-activated chloride channel family protein
MRTWLYCVSAAALLQVFVGCSAEDKTNAREGGGGSGQPTQPPSATGVGSGAGGSTGTGASSKEIGGDRFAAPRGDENTDPMVPFDANSCPQLPATPLYYAMSADDSNSMGSPGYARDMLTAGLAPSPAILRTYEFLNYYNAVYAPPEAGTLAIIPQIAEGMTPQQQRLQIGVQAPLPEADRRPMTVTLVVDTSSSMAGRAILNARAVVRAVSASLLPGDRVNLVTFDVEAEPVISGLEIQSKADVELVSERAAQLVVGGGSDLQGGLVRGYSLAFSHYMEGGLNRLVLVTDGRTNPALVDMRFVGEHAQSGDDKGIYLVGVGTGPAKGYSDTLLQELTDVGRGAYVYVDSEAEAQEVFSKRWSEVMDIAARGVSVSLSLPRYFELQSYYGEDVSHVPGEIEPQHLAPGDAMVFNMDFSVCDPAQIKDEDIISVTVSWETPIDRHQMSVTRKMSIAEVKANGTAQLVKSTAVVAYAEALRSLDHKRLEAALGTVKKAQEALGGNDEDLKEIEGLLALHPALAAGGAQ